MNLEDLRALLQRDEIDYGPFRAPDAGAEFGADLARLVGETDGKVAAAAAYALCLAGAQGEGLYAHSIAQDPRVLVRVAFAAGLAEQAAPPPATVAALLDDEDAGVRKFAVRAAARIDDPYVRARLERIGADRGQPEYLREAARRALGGRP